MKRIYTTKNQSGSSLIEVLVAVLILSFGMLALGGMLAYSIQAPKLAGYRATAAVLAASHVDRMRTNPADFDGTTNSNGLYIEPMTYGDGLVYDYDAWCSGFLNTSTTASNNQCKSSQVAQSKFESNRAIRQQLPGGGMRVICTGNCNSREGELWVMWLEPTSIGQLTSSSDECPDASVAPTFVAFTSPVPRCLHIRFKL